MIRPDGRTLALTGLLAALGVVLGFISFPVGPVRVAPGQHLVNALSGVLVGPFWGALAALVTASIRFLTGAGTIFAFPGSPFGAVAVGLAFLIWRRPAAALAEPIGTVGLGATLSAALFAPLIGVEVGLTFFVTAFAASAIPGAVLGAVLLLALERLPGVRELLDRQVRR